jgi:hypothetical protein
MLVTITLKNNAWLLIPIEGKFTGKLVGVADHVSLIDVTRYSNTMRGKLMGVWGLTLLKEHLDAVTSKGLVGKRPFDMTGLRPVPIDYFSEARRVVVQGPRAFIGV